MDKDLVPNKFMLPTDRQGASLGPDGISGHSGKPDVQLVSTGNKKPPKIMIVGDDTNFNITQQIMSEHPDFEFQQITKETDPIIALEKTLDRMPLDLPKLPRLDFSNIMNKQLNHYSAAATKILKRRRAEKIAKKSRKKNRH